MRRLFFILLLLFFQGIFSQTTFSGIITGELNRTISGATITVSDLFTDTIVSFDISSEKGEYIIQCNSKSDSLYLEVSFIGYTKIIKKIANRSQKNNFKLRESNEELKEVVIKSLLPITRNGDTLKYAVSAFKSKKDRVIADVLAKMPGIQVESDGKILYEGKPIQKYYIEGIDLLEGKYNLANNNLPADAVSKVEILENHQPIKLLDSLVSSDKTSLNIKLKNKVAFTGQAIMGAGFTPALWDVNITPMLFGKDYQMISTYQSNNTGNNVVNQLKKLTINLLDDFNNGLQKRDWLDIREISHPPFKENFWLDNKAHLISLNYLKRIKKNTDFKVNISYSNDINNQIGKTNTIFYAKDRVNIKESIENNSISNVLKAELVYEENKKNSYLKNTFEGNKYWSFKNGIVKLNDEIINQQLDNPFKSFGNKLKWIFPFKKELITFKSIIGYTKTPQNLIIPPNVFGEFINVNEIEKVNQNINLTAFFTDNSVSLTKGYKNLSVSSKLGILFEDKKLNSEVKTYKKGAFNLFSPNFNNNIIFNKINSYVEFNSKYKKGKWEIGLNLPSRSIFLQQENNTAKKKELIKFVFEPELRIKRKINNFWRASISGSLTNDFGDINQLYDNYIIEDYRNIKKYNSPISENNRQNIYVGVFHRKALKSFFMNIFYSYNRTKKNLLLTTNLNENGFSELIFLKQDNININNSLNIRISKFFKELKTTIISHVNFSTDKNDLFINNVLNRVNNNRMGLKTTIDSELNNWFSINSKLEWSRSNIKFSDNSINGINNQNYSMNFVFYLDSNKLVKLENSMYKSTFSMDEMENFFLNLKYRYTMKKRKIDFEVKLSNLLNTKSYTTNSINSFQSITTEYSIRPRQFFFSVKFGL